VNETWYAQMMEEAWRTAVRRVLGADAYAKVQIEAARIRDEEVRRLQADCEHEWTPHPVSGKPRCLKCETGCWRGDEWPTSGQPDA